MEKWKDVLNYEGIYEVSNIGRVRTAKGKTTESILHGTRVWKQRILKQKTDRNGYKRVTLWKEKEAKGFLVHRLVADSFINNPEEFNLINHMDGNPSNNHVYNLEWCDYERNNNHAFDNGLMKTNFKIVLVNKETNEPRYFRSMAKASSFLGRNNGYLSSVLKKGVTELSDYHIFMPVELIKNDNDTPQILK